MNHLLPLSQFIDIISHNFLRHFSWISIDFFYSTSPGISNDILNSGTLWVEPNVMLFIFKNNYFDKPCKYCGHTRQWSVVKQLLDNKCTGNDLQCSVKIPVDAISWNYWSKNNNTFYGNEWMNEWMNEWTECESVFLFYFLWKWNSTIL